MKSLKELIKTTLVEYEALNNLSEKDCQEYRDKAYDEVEVPELWRDVANSLADKVMRIDFSKYERSGFHTFVKCKSLARKLGFDSVAVCAYKCHTHSQWLDSNFMAQSHMGENNEPYTSLYFDIYDCESLDKEKLYGFIIQELFNFQRDIEWLDEGADVYDAKMEEMK
jgi:hypothetical protein